MAYKLSYSDYSTASGPPDPAAWIGPPGPMGPPGPQGIPGPIAEGGPFLPLSGGAVSGPTTHTSSAATTPLLVTANPVVGGSTLAQSFYTQTNASGATTATGQPLWNMFLTTDAVNASGANSVANVGNYYTLQGSSGARIAQQISLSINGNTNDPVGSGHYMQALGCSILANGTVGGNTSVHSGQAFGANITATLGAAAKYLISVVGFEADVACQAGSSVDYKYGITAVLQNADAVASTFPSAAFSVGLAVDSPASPGWRYGLAFGGPLGWWPINPTTGVLIYADPSGQSGGPAHACATGIDFSAVTFSSAFLKSTGFQVNGGGSVTALNATLTGSGTALTLSSGNLVVQGVTALTGMLSAFGGITSPHGSFNSGIDLNGQVASGQSDLTKGIDFYNGQYGFCLTGGFLNYNAPVSAVHAFLVNGVQVGSIGAGGIMTGPAGSPTWTTGSAAPAATTPVGSLYSRVGGAVGATLYVSRGGGTWAAVAGV